MRCHGATLLWTYVCLTAATATAYRILAYEPGLGHSHWNVMSAVLESLVDAGHEVVCVTMHAPAGRLAGHPNYTHVDASPECGGPVRDLDYGRILELYSRTTSMLAHMVARERRTCETFYARPGVPEKLARDGGGRPYDAVVVESLYTECHSSRLGRLGVPIVYVVPCPTVDWMPVATGSPGHPSYLGTLLADSPTPDTFGGRLANALAYVHTKLVRWYHDAGARRDIRRPAPRRTMVFVNTHHSLEPARPTGPNVVEIGGIHLRGPPAPVPGDLLEVLEKSNEFGVIVFTFGSIVAMNKIPENILEVFKLVFRQLPQTVIWKYENDHMLNKPENVILYKWLPQRKLLQHPNVKLFITHGGMSGIYESVDAGIPVLGFPFAFDQIRNIKSLEDVGMALSLDMKVMTKTTLLLTINSILKNSSFSENAKRVSILFHDRPVTPSDSVVYWTEYLIRHGQNANHLRPMSADATWTSHFLVDLFVALAIMLFIMWYCVRTIVYKTLRKLKSSSVRN